MRDKGGEVRGKEGGMREECVRRDEGERVRYYVGEVRYEGGGVREEGVREEGGMEEG